MYEDMTEFINCRNNELVSKIDRELGLLTGETVISENTKTGGIIINKDTNPPLYYLFFTLIAECEAIAFVVNHNVGSKGPAREWWKGVIDKHIEACKKYAPRVIEDAKGADWLIFPELKILYGELPLGE